MSATVNEDAVKAVSNQSQSNDPGSFRSHIAPTGPMTDKGVSEHSAMSKIDTGGLILIDDSLAINLVLTVANSDQQHQPGRKVSPNDKAPEFQTKVLPPGSAPKDRTFYPQPADHEFPPVAKYMNDAELEEDVPITTGEDTIGSTDSADVDKGLGKPLSGELSSELRHNGMHKRKREKQGLERVGADGGGDKIPGNVASHDGLNEMDPASAN